MRLSHILLLLLFLGVPVIGAVMYLRPSMDVGTMYAIRIATALIALAATLSALLIYLWMKRGSTGRELARLRSQMTQGRAQRSGVRNLWETVRHVYAQREKSRAQAQDAKALQQVEELREQVRGDVSAVRQLARELHQALHGEVSQRRGPAFSEMTLPKALEFVRNLFSEAPKTASQLRQQLQAAQEARSVLQKRLDGLAAQAEAEKADARRQRLLERRDSAGIQEVQKKLASVQAKFAELSQASAVQERALKGELDAARKQVSEVAALNERISGELAAANSEIGRQARRIESLLSGLEQEKSLFAGLAVNFEELKRERLSLQRALTESQELCRQLEANLQSCVSELAALKTKSAALEAEVNSQPLVASMIGRMSSAFESQELAERTLQPLAKDSPEEQAAQLALILLPDGAGRASALIRTAQARLQTSEAAGGEDAEQACRESYARLMRFAAAAMERHQGIEFFMALDPDVRLSVCRQLDTKMQLLLVARHMAEPQLVPLILPDDVLVKVLDLLPAPCRAALCQMQPDPAKAASCLFASHAIYEACRQMAKLLPGYQRNRHLDPKDPRQLKIKREILAKERPTNPKTGRCVFDDARRAANAVFYLNEGWWRRIWTEYAGDSEKLKNARELLGYDVRDFLLFLDPSRENLRAQGLSDSHLSNFEVIADLADPDRREGQIDCVRECILNVGRTLGGTAKTRELRQNLVGHAQRLSSILSQTT